MAGGGDGEKFGDAFDDGDDDGLDQAHVDDFEPQKYNISGSVCHTETMKHIGVT